MKIFSNGILIGKEVSRPPYLSRLFYWLLIKLFYWFSDTAPVCKDFPIDHFTPSSPAPEPAIMLLLGLGLVGPASNPILSIRLAVCLLNCTKVQYLSICKWLLSGPQEDRKMMISAENAQEKWCPHDYVHPYQRDEMKRTCSGPDCRMWRFSVTRPGVILGDGTYTEAIEKAAKNDLDRKGYCVLNLLKKARTLKG